jgi:serine protease Do
MIDARVSILAAVVLWTGVVCADDRPAKAPSAAARAELRKGYLLAPKAFRAAVNRVRPAMVAIEAFGGIAPVKKKGRGGARPGDGPTTGLIVSADGYVLTSTYNLITRPPIITVIRADGSRHVAKLVGRDDTRRICLLKIDGDSGRMRRRRTIQGGVKDWPVAKYVPADSLRIGQWAVSAGLGLGSDPVISAGVISAKNRIGGRAVQTDANISPVNYGGPLVDVEGNVIGLCVPINPRTNDPSGGVEWYDSGIGFAIPLAELTAVIDAMKAGKTVQPASLGVRVKDGEPGKPGVEVLDVVNGSAAAKAGLKKGDRILKLGGRTVATATELRFALARFMAGQQAEIVTQRDGKQQTQSVTLDRGTAPKPPAAKTRRKIIPAKRPSRK